MNNKFEIFGGLIGLCIGDALGVPVEFISRKVMKRNPVRGMIGYGTHDLPPGSWSDDSSLTFCLTDALCNGYNLKEIGHKFVLWKTKGLWTPSGKARDVGRTTAKAIKNLRNDPDHPLQAGEAEETNNGNGSLMRILPLVWFTKNMDYQERDQIISDVSSITHAHRRAVLGCIIYIELCIQLVKGLQFQSAYYQMRDNIKTRYHDEKELKAYSRILDEDISRVSENKISSSGYVVHTLEASIWCMLKGDSFKDTLLTSVNLGYDTDTVGAVTGGLAGIYYGYDNIPEEWVNTLIRLDDILELINQFANVIPLGDC